jgi:hypothetical protein
MQERTKEIKYKRRKIFEAEPSGRSYIVIIHESYWGQAAGPDLSLFDIRP